jgi:hypothetical protein
MQERDPLWGKPQADPENSCPRSPTTNVGSTTKHTNNELASKTKKQSHCDTYATRHVQRLLDKLQTKLLGRASDTVPSGNRTSASNSNKNYHFVSNPKIKRNLVVQCSGLATATSSQAQSRKNILDGFS